MWMRLCVDVEQNGNVRGWSVERRDEWGRTNSILVGPVGPFDTAQEALDAAHLAALDNWGAQGALFA